MTSTAKRLARLEAPHQSYSPGRGCGVDETPADICHAIGGAVAKQPSIQLGVSLFQLMHWPSTAWLHITYPRAQPLPLPGGTPEARWWPQPGMRPSPRLEGVHHTLLRILRAKLRAGAFKEPSKRLKKHLRHEPLWFWGRVVAHVLIECMTPNPCWRCSSAGVVMVRREAPGEPGKVQLKQECCPVCFGHGQAPQGVATRAKALGMRLYTFVTEVQPVYVWLVSLIRTLASSAARKIAAQFGEEDLLAPAAEV